MSGDLDAAMARRCQIMRAALEEIEQRLPALHEEAEQVWSDRRWNGEFRDLQRVARAALEAAKKA